MTAPGIAAVAPFFIVGDVSRSLDFFRDKLAFKVEYMALPDDPIFALIRRGGAMFMLKTVEVEPLPNRVRDPSARWDASMSTPAPDALAAEFAGRDVEFRAPASDSEEGLRGFEVSDIDGYVLHFGSPRGEA